MKDVQSGPADVSIPIDRAGVKNLSLPLVVKDRTSGTQHTVAQVDLSVDLPAEFKGTHMSRFVEALENWGEDLDYHSFKKLLADIADRLKASRAFARFRFPYFLRRSSPATGSRSLMGYGCVVEGEYQDGRLIFTLGVDVPVMTVCPCSLAISDQGAHSQRAEVRIRARVKGFVWLEDLIDMAEAAGSSPVYALLKREDEKAVTENAFANPTFVEDVVRNTALKLICWNGDQEGRDQSQRGRITWFRVEVESFESIHAHSAYASLEKTLEKS